jgi:hypothetical protein
MQVKDIGSVVLLQACISFFGCITRVSAKDSDSMCVLRWLACGTSAQQPPPDHPAHRFLKVLYGARPADAVLSSRKHNDLLVFEHQARPRAVLHALRSSPHAASVAQISMLTEYSALIAVPVFIFAGAYRAQVAPLQTVGHSKSACARPLAGRITLGGVLPDMSTLVNNTVAQVIVQAFVDLVRLQHCSGLAHARALTGPARLLRYRCCTMCSTTTSTTW